MTLPLLGPMTLSGFEHAWFFLFLLVVLGAGRALHRRAAARQRRTLRFANLELLESVAPKRPTRWRHLPAILLVLSLAAAHRRDGRADGRRPDPAQPRHGHAGDRRVAVDAGHRRAPNRLAAAQEAAKQFVDELTPGINLGLISFAGTATVLVSPTTNREAPRRDRQAATGRTHRHRRGDLHRAAGHRHRRRGDRWR